MKKIFGVMLASMVLMLALAPITRAAEFIAPDKDSGNVLLSSTDAHANLYTAGRTVFVNSPTTGDLFVAGGDVTIEGNVDQDLVVMGGTVTVNGSIGDDVRIAGGNVTLNGMVGGDVLVAGGSVNLTEKAHLSNDFYAAAGEVTIGGFVNGIAKIKADRVTVTGTLNSSSYITARQSFVIGELADTKSIDYKGEREQVVKEGAKVESINFIKTEHRNRAHRAAAAIFTIMFVVKIVGLLIAGLILIKLLPRTNRQLAEAMQKGIWANLGLGIIGLIVVPIVAVIAMALIVGLYVGIILMLAWLLMLVIASLTASIVTGAWIINKLTKKGSMVYDWQALVIGLIAISIVYLVPFIGMIVMLALVLMAFGGVMRHFHDHVKSEHSAD